MFKRTLMIGLCCLLWAHLDKGCELYAQKTRNDNRTTQKKSTNVAAPQMTEAVVVVPEYFVNAFLDAIFTQLKAPVFPLTLTSLDLKMDKRATAATAHALSAQSCASVIILEREVSGIRTSVKFEDNRIVAPLAFSGSYRTGLLGCIQFRGWANTLLALDFDQSRQTLNARVKVTDMQLAGLSPIANNLVSGIVQNAIDRRFNPWNVLRVEQLSARLPITAAGGALHLRARDMRAEVVRGELRLHIRYEFARAE
jgi:hypothetical protein